jgi:predicted adenylyl cyclase CyaB
METNQEIEKRALLSAEQLAQFKKKLESMGAKQVAESRIHDVYFCPNAVKSFSELEMNEVGSYSLRLRDEEEGKSSEKTINTKVITSKGDHNSWVEYEITIDSIETAGKIIETIGFKPFCDIDKKRKTFKVGRMSVLLEDIRDFGFGVEVEILSSKEDSDKAKKEIDDFFRAVGVREDQVVSKSITNIIMRAKSKF